MVVSQSCSGIHFPKALYSAEYQPLFWSAPRLRPGLPPDFPGRGPYLSQRKRKGARPDIGKRAQESCHFHGLCGLNKFSIKDHSLPGTVQPLGDDHPVSAKFSVLFYGERSLTAVCLFFFECGENRLKKGPPTESSGREVWMRKKRTDKGAVSSSPVQTRSRMLFRRREFLTQVFSVSPSSSPTRTCSTRGRPENR